MDTDLSHEALERFDELDRRVSALEVATGLAQEPETEAEVVVEEGE